MDTMDSYKIDLNGVKLSAVSRQFSLGDDFFSAVNGPEIRHGSLDVALTVNYASGAYQVQITLVGTVQVECDRCMQPMNQDIHTQESLKVRLGQEYSDDGETITIPEKDGILDLSWNIYEAAALAIPIRHVHPDGQCDPTVQHILEGKATTETKQIDPRWSALQKLKTS